MTAKTKAQIAAEIASSITTNGTGRITGAVLATALSDINDSVLFTPEAQAILDAATAANTAAQTAATNASGSATAAGGSASSAAASATTASSASASAIAAGRIYASTTAGIAATTSGQYFSVPQAAPNASLLDLYLNSSGTAIYQNSYPSVSSLNGVAATAAQIVNKTLPLTRNLFDRATINNNQTITRTVGTHGALTAQTGTFVTDFIPVDQSVGTFIANAAMAGDTQFGGYCFYDYNKALISGGDPVAAATPVSVPGSAVWMRCAFDGTVSLGGLMIVNGSALPSSLTTHIYYDALGNRSLYLKQVSETVGLVNLFDQTAITASSYLNSNDDTLTANSNYYVTGYIPVSQGGQITFNGTDTLDAPYGMAWYDISQTLISGAAGHGTPPVAGTPYTVPVGAAYVRCTFAYATVPPSGLVAVQGATLPAFYVPFGIQQAVTYLRHWAGTSVVHLGDSITANFAGATQWTGVLAARLQTTIMANLASPGRVMRDLLKNPSTGLDLAASSFTGCGLVICFAGTNDFTAAYAGTGVLGSPSDTASYSSSSFCANTKYIMETLYGFAIAGMRVVFFTPMYRNAASGLDATATTPEGKTLYDYADAVKSCAGIYGIPCLDLIRTAGLNKFNYASYLADGLHPNGTDNGITIIEKPAAAFLSSIR